MRPFILAAFALLVGCAATLLLTACAPSGANYGVSYDQSNTWQNPQNDYHHYRPATSVRRPRRR